MIKIAALKDNIVINIYLYDDMAEAIHFHEMGAFVGSDNFVEAPDGTDVGDFYDPITGEFSKPIRKQATEQPPRDLYELLQADMSIVYQALAAIYEKIGVEKNG